MTTRSNQLEKTNNGKSEQLKRFKQNSISLEPGIARRIGLGAYDKSEPEPEFTLSFEPEDMQERVRVAFDQMKIPGTKRTLYFCILLNTGNKRCRATIALRNTGER